ncbi:hypothetical protein GCK72_015935 [Caenorhabditis remanei]|uniref:Transmembrane protein 144 n=1 Tax=Caenorhabditis remanei TaxID=31234 RepID=A0A6A5GVG9_CAERE|nr:hypothetical protein GCK72_015935 [Caenorhabditis remanei]KAF1759468.1 hypothetical protein GCK72_015935 [Caenorhabditis remanei]
METKTITGIVYSFISAATLGSTLVPLKFFDRSDGIYFQWVQTMGQLMVGVFLTMFTTPSPVLPVAMINGVFYAIGNSFSVFIMENLGMAIGYLIWNSVACIVGWAVTRYGLFYNIQQIPKCEWLSVLGIAGIILGSAIFTMVKKKSMRVRPAPWSTLEDQIKHAKKTKEEPPIPRKIVCLLLTMFVGFLYGNFYSPISYLMTNDPGASQDVRSYFLSYCLGASFTSTVIFMGYSVVMKNVPRCNPELTTPSIVSGILYGVGMLSFFTACQNLDQVIAYPILSKAPGIVVSLWAIFLFKEIQGRKNIIQLFFGIFVTLLGICCVSLSKVLDI